MGRIRSFPSPTCRGNPSTVAWRVPNWIGPINVAAKRAGERSAGNLPALIEGGGAENGVARPPHELTTLPLVRIQQGVLKLV